MSDNDRVGDRPERVDVGTADSVDVGPEADRVPDPVRPLADADVEAVRRHVAVSVGRLEADAERDRVRPDAETDGVAAEPVDESVCTARTVELDVAEEEELRCSDSDGVAVAEVLIRGTAVLVLFAVAVKVPWLPEAERGGEPATDLAPDEVGLAVLPVAVRVSSADRVEELLCPR